MSRSIAVLVVSFAASGCLDVSWTDPTRDPSTGRPGNVPPEGSGPLTAPPPPEPCESELAHFDAELWRPILSSECAGCHVGGGAAQGTRFVLPEDGAPEDRYRALARVASLDLGETPLLVLKPTGLHPEGHVGGARITVGSGRYEALAAFAAYARTQACDSPRLEAECAAPEPGPRILRRLTGREYDNSLRVALGVESDWGARFPADPVVHGFEGHAPSLFVSTSLGEHLFRAAEDIASQVDLQSLAPCDARQRGCREQLINGAGRRLYRRPLLPGERDRLLRLADEAPGEEGLRLVLSALLQSPHFLYRSELGTASEGAPVFRLSAWEIASELSYFLTGSGPDERLLQAAESGGLDSPAGLAQEARRLAQSAAGRAQQVRFFEQWLELSRIDTVPKDAAVYPELDASLRSALRQETQRFILSRLEAGATLAEILSAPYTEVEPSLARFYGEEGTAGSNGLVRLQTPGRHFGLLTQGSLLSVHARPNDSSPVHRGQLIRERLLCQDLPSPPPGIDADPPPPTPGQTTRERYQAHSQDPACRGCHRLIDPIGFGFEVFDGLGRFRAGQPIDASGEVVETRQSDGPFTDFPGLVEKLASSVDVRACFVRQWLRFSTGLDDDPRIACLRADLARSFGPESTVEDLVVAIATSIHFTERRGEPISTPPEPEPTPEPNPTPEPTPSPLEVTQEIDSEWQTGACVHVTIRNLGDTAVDWAIEIDLEGTLTNHWNAEVSGNAGRVRFRGLSWNRNLQPGGSARIGYCIAK